MFGWRRKTDGFEWHKYVRTTIKLRRNERRKQIDRIKHKAADNVRHVGAASASAGRWGLARAMEGARRGLVIGAAWCRQAPGRLATLSRHGLRGTRRITVLSARGLGFAGRIAAAGVVRMSSLTAKGLQRPGVSPLFAGAAVATGLYALIRFLFAGAVSSEVAIAALIAAVLGLLAIVALTDRSRLALFTPRRPLAGFFGWLTGLRQRLPDVSLRAPWKIRAPWTKRIAVVGAGLAAVAVIVLGGRTVWPESGNTIGSIGSLSSLVMSSNETITGRARVYSGDTLSVAGTIVRLSGIEAPELSQRCRNPRGRVWQCGQTARRALKALIGRKSVSCEITRDSSQPFAPGRCRVDKDQDLARDLVRAGYAFAITGLLSRYGSDEQAARDRKAGVWQGKAVRPAEYRATQWARAKRRAPDGCPIKAHARRGRKLYVLPWSPQYRRVRVSSRRGDKWFCSEADALAAGWRPATSG